VLNDAGSLSALDRALRQFEAAEANLTKLERLWKEIEHLTPSGIEFSGNREYEDRCRSYEAVLGALPKIDGWKPTATPLHLDDIRRHRFDAAELDEPSAHLSVARFLNEQIWCR